MRNLLRSPKKYNFGRMIMDCRQTGNTKGAKQLFDLLKKGKLPFTANVIDCTQLVQTFGNGQKFREAVDVLDFMDKKKIELDRAAFLALLKACSKDGSYLELGKQLHTRINKSDFALDNSIQTSLLNMYFKCNDMEGAQTLFSQLQKQGKPSLFNWTTMIAGFSQNRPKEALRLFDEMKNSRVEPDPVTWTSLVNACSNLGDLTKAKEIHHQIEKKNPFMTDSLQTGIVSMYGKCGSLEDAKMAFSKFQKKNSRLNASVWTALIVALAQNGKSNEAFDLFEQMKREGISPTVYTWTSLIMICNDIDLGRQIHMDIVKSGIVPDTTLYNTLLNMYGKYGKLEEARKTVF
eukprot:TRINITY_DN10737_c0_g1_i1.p2 TRINITY_DN10737_c0_g1~~TRINITY_DN10737_c0_g1_i1.p2  ORF type:complete len:407 (-),score=82.72 TRINITY_DN10737_c0_g1_i1:1317-2360(-)